MSRISYAKTLSALRVVRLIVCRQNRMDKYYYYIRLRMNTPESTGFFPVAYSICKHYCGKLFRRSSKKKPRASPASSKPAGATSPLLRGQMATAGVSSPFRGRGPPRLPPRTPGFAAIPRARLRPPAGPRFPPPASFPAAFTRLSRPPTMQPRPGSSAQRT